MAEFEEWSLDAGAEYRFELDEKSSLAIKLVQGDAEIFGAELALGRTYLFGAELSLMLRSYLPTCLMYVSGKPSAEYVSDETPMDAYANIHVLLEQMRASANRAARDWPPLPDIEHGDTRPPRVLVIGPENSGKSTACKILVNYAVRSPGEWAPIIVNLDPNNGGFTVPGTLSATSVDAPLLAMSPASSLGSTATSAPVSVSSSALLPVVSWFGFPEPKKSPALIEYRIHELAEMVSERLRSDSLAEPSGIIIDSSSSFALSTPYSGAGDQKFPLVQLAVDAFNVNVIIVVGNEKLHVEMQRLFGTFIAPNPDIVVVKVPKSGGVAELDHLYRDRMHAHQIRTYFYGTPLFLPEGMTEADLGPESASLVDGTLAPFSSVVSFDELIIYRIGGETMAPSSALPIGSAPIISETKPVRIDPAQPGSALLNTVLALLAPITALPVAHNLDLALTGEAKPNTSEPAEVTDEQILAKDVAGYLLITAMDIPHRKMTILAPSPGPLTGRVAVAGAFEWQDQ